MSDHITECGNCYAEVQSVCEFVDAAVEAKRLRAEVRDLRRRIREARRLLSGPEPRFVMDDVLAVLDLRRKKGRKKR